MPVKSETSRLLDRIIATGPAPLLKQQGYRKLARSFHAESGELFKVVQFQASMWNTPDAAQFTVNLMIVLPFYHEKWTGQPFPKNPGSAAPVLSQKEAGLPFLDRHADVQVLAHAAEQKETMRRMAINPELCLAILLSFLDKRAEAVRVVEELATKNKHQGFAETIRLIARRLELKADI